MLITLMVRDDGSNSDAVCKSKDMQNSRQITTTITTIPIFRHKAIVKWGKIICECLPTGADIQYSILPLIYVHYPSCLFI